MIYLQPIRSRKENLVPFRGDTDGDMKIEILDVSALKGMELVSMDSDQFIEVMTAPPSPASSTMSNSDSVRPRKRAKLDHLTHEEKAQHRKMMNRISAQSARDRQKAHIMQQDKSIQILTVENETLKGENCSLKVKNEKLTEENMSLRARIEELENQMEKMSTVNSVGAVVIKEEPAPVQEVSECCASFEPAEGTRVTTDASFPVSDVGNLPIDLDAPEVIEALERFTEQILSPEHQLINLEQIIATAASIGEENTNVAELVNNESGYTWVENNGSDNHLSMDVDAVTVNNEPDDDTHSSHSESGLPLEEGEFGLLPDPVSPPAVQMVLPLSLAHVKKEAIVAKETFDNFNAFLDSGFDITDSWNDEQLFPDLTFRDDILIS